MSMPSFEDVWDFHVLAREYPCLCCKQNIMNRDDHKTWRRGHIIHDTMGGSNIIENIRPICLECNIRDTKKQGFNDSYEYMVFLGTMSQEERFDGLMNIRSINPEISKSIRCSALLQNGNHCSNTRRPYSKTCKIHGRGIRDNLKKVFGEVRKLHEKTYNYLISIGEIEEADVVRTMMLEISDFREAIL
jgi:hypothetical protein